MTMPADREQLTRILNTPLDWPVRRLCTFASKVGSGATPRGGQSVYLSSRVSHALIRSQHVHDRWFDSTDLAYISAEHSHELRNAEVRKGDVLLNITGDGVTFGRACIVPNEIMPACVNQHVSIIRVNHDVCIPEYLLAFLTHQVTKRYISSFSTGGSRRAITKGHIELFEIPLPPINIQRQIAEILSIYDQLIENNQRRIQIMESMARSLHREWFVHFRFPGHTKIPLIASPLGDIPKGWNVGMLGEVADIKWGDTSTTKASYIEGGYDAYSASGLDGQLDHYDFDRPGIVLSAIGAQCGKTWFARGKWSCIKNTMRFWSKDPKVSNEFLFIATEKPDFWPRRGAAQPFISQGDAERKLLLIPTRLLMTEYSKFVSNVLEQVSVLRAQMRNLRRTRDLLLPHLLSGQIDLSQT